MIQSSNDDKSWSSEKYSPREDSSIAESCPINTIETEDSDYSDFSFSEPNSATNESSKPATSAHTLPKENYTNETVTVKFHVNYEDKTDELFTKAFNRHLTVHTIKSELTSLLQIPQHHISIEKDDQELNDDTSLTKLGVPVLGIIELNVKLTPVSACKLDKDLIYGHIPTLDVITVRIQHNKHFVKHLVVEIEDEQCQKPWLGGYRHRITRTEYHHAQTQTYSLKTHNDNNVDRSTQFTSMENRQTNTSTDKVVQISPHMFSIPSQTDRILIPRSHDWTTISQMESEHKPKKQDKDESVKEISNGVQSATEEHIPTVVSTDLNKMLKPLRDEIEKWNTTQNLLLNNLPNDRNTATQRKLIVNQTVKFINRLNQFKSKLFNAQSSSQNRLFDKYTKSNIFTSKTGSKISIQTVFNQKAKTLNDLYVKYNDTAITGIDKVHAIKDLIEFFKTLPNDKFSSEIMSLLEEQMDLLSQGLGHTNSLQTRVHQRISHFLQYAAFTPHNDYEDDFGQISCHAMTTSLSKHKLDTYWQLLSRLRNDETKIFTCFTSLCFKLRPAEFGHLIGNIWQNTPIIGNDHELSDTNQWIVTRWNVREEWTPWNCVLLTRNYFNSHLKVDNVEQYYDASVISSVRNNHIKAKMYFHKLLNIQIV